MLSEVQRATSHKEDVVFLGWAPHPMNVNFKIEYLTGGDDSSVRTSEAPSSTPTSAPASPPIARTRPGSSRISSTLSTLKTW